MLIASTCLISCKEHIRMNTMVVTSESRYVTNNASNMSLYSITYKTTNINAGNTIYVVADSDLFEVGDKVKIIKTE